jgi:phage portal protein BeeE
MARTPPKKPVRKAKTAPAPRTPRPPRPKPIEKTYIKGQDPRIYLSGAQPGVWATNHLEESMQCRGWQFVAVRTLSRMCSQAELIIHRVNDVQGAVRQIDRINRKISKAGRIYDPIIRKHKIEYLEAEREKWKRRAFQKTAPDSLKPDREVAAPNMPLVKLLQRPNPEWSGVTFLFALIQQIALTGTGLVWCIRNGMGAPVELYVIPTGLAIPRAPSAEFPKGSYWITPLSAWGLYSTDLWNTGMMGQALLIGCTVDARDVKKICWPHPLYLTDGLSPLSAGATWVDLGNEMDRSAWYRFQNAERPGMIWERDPLVDPSPDDMAQFREDLKADSAGTPNTGKHLITPKGLKPSAWGSESGELEYVGSRPQIRDMNLSLHGVTPTACGIQEAASFSTFVSAIKQTTELAVQPLLNLVAGELTEFVGQGFGGRHEITLNAPAIDDPQTLEQRLRTDITAGNVLKVNEYRALRGLPPLDGEEGEAFVGEKPPAAQPMQAPGQPAHATPPQFGDGVTPDKADQDAKPDTPTDAGPNQRQPERDAPQGRPDLNGKSHRKGARR